MKTTFSAVRSRTAIFIPVFSFLLLFSACKVQFVPNYDADLAREIGDANRKIENFYLTMMDVKAADRQYTSFSTKYADIGADLNSILLKNKVRPLNTESSRIAEITLQLWEKYREEHKKDNALSDGLIKLNKKTFNDMFFAMQVAEEGKKVSSNSTP